MLRTFYRFTLRFLAVCLIGLFLLIGIAYIFLENSIDYYMSETAQQELFAEINNSPELPFAFYTIEEKYQADIFTRSFWQNLRAGIWGAMTNQHHDTTDCPCYDLRYVYLAYDKDKTRIVNQVFQWVLALELEEKCGARKCYDFAMHAGGFDYTKCGVEQVAIFYFDKTPAELNEKEILTLKFMRKSPSLYNPRRNPENLERKMQALRNGVNK